MSTMTIQGEQLGYRCGRFEPEEIRKPFDRYLRNVRLLKKHVNDHSADLPDNENVRVSLDELRALVAVLSRKPNLCLLGEFDAGKSTLANLLMGSDSLPAKIAPHTALPTVVRHSEEKAEWMGEDLYILDTFLPPVSWDDKELIERHLVISGPIELLNQATHKRSRLARTKRKAPEGFEGARMALAFIHSPILHACNLIDFPGYGHDDHDEEKAQRFETMADIVMYLSPVNGFLKSQEIYRIGQAISKIGDFEPVVESFPLLGNLFIVASHADPRKYEKEDIAEVFESASYRIMRQVGEFAIAEKADRIGMPIYEDSIADRIFLFWKNRDEACVTFDEKLLSLLAVELPMVWRERARLEIDTFREQKTEMVDAVIEVYEKRLAELHEMEKVYERYRDEEAGRKHRMRQKVDGILTQIRRFSTQSCEEFSGDFVSLIDPSRLERLIREKYSDKKEGQEYAFGYVHELASKKLKDILTPKTQRISDATEVFVQEYRDQQVLEGSAIDVGLTSDDMGTFLAGATATGTLGALASLGLMYGGSWLAAHTTGLLAAAGAGAASVDAAVAAGIGYALSVLTGPIGIAIISGIALFALFRAPWQERLAKEIAKKMVESEAQEQFLKAIRQYWKDTESAFLGGVAELEKRWERSLEELRQQIADPEEGGRELTAILEGMSQAKSFFLEIPWDGNFPVGDEDGAGQAQT